MNPMKYISSGIIAGLLLGGNTVQAQHLNVGAIGQNQNDALVWANADELAHSSGYVKALTPATSGRYAGLYNGNITLTSLHNTDSGGPAPGSFLVAEIVSVMGPSGAFFGWWEAVDLGGSTTPTFSIATGSSDLSLRYALSDALLGAGQAGQDPYGHIHGRRFTATHEGQYTVGFRAVDTSINGTGGGPIHASSGVIYLTFAAVPEPSMLAIGAASLLGLWCVRRKRQS